MTSRWWLLVSVPLLAVLAFVLGLSTGGRVPAAALPTQVQVQSVFTVDTQYDSDFIQSPNCNDAAHSQEPGKCTLREAINRANDLAGNTKVTPSILFNVTPAVEVDSPLPHVMTQTYMSGHSNSVNRQRIAWFGGSSTIIPDGLVIDAGASNTTIDHVGVDGFGGSGITVSGANFTLTGSFVGKTSFGFPNGVGIVLKAPGARIGGTTGKTAGVVSCTGDCNFISGNDGDGIFAYSTATGATITGNYIGIDENDHALGNGVFGILSSGEGLTLGGDTPEAANVIAGSQFEGVRLLANATVKGNLIGTDATGIHAVPNMRHGIFISANGGETVIGGAGGAGNLISGNGQDGVYSVSAGRVTILGNKIGTRMDGTTSLANGYEGVYADGGPVIVGGPGAGEGNLIAFNGDFGVQDNASATGVTIRGNSIHDNFASGIDSATPAAPVIAQAWTAGAIGTACANCIVDLYSDADGQGETYEGATTADGGGAWFFGGAIAGPHVTATATDGTGNTSGFSLPADLGLAPSGTPTPTGTPTPVPSVTPTHTATPVPSVTPTHTPTSERIEGDVNCDGNVDDGDLFFLLEYAAGLNDGTTPGSCPDVGSASVAVGASYPWGDVNCDGGVDSVDALYVEAHEADIQLHVPAGCPAVGQPIT
ncbi:MAG: hypothetical protein ABI559_01915 [Chloroflexota bacterium]